MRNIIKIVLIIYFLLLMNSLRAQLVNETRWYWDAHYTSTLTSRFSNNSVLSTNFYKFVVVKSLNSLENIFPGDVYYLRIQLHNVGNKNDTNGIQIHYSCNNSSITLSLYNDVNPSDGADFKSGIDTLNTSNLSPQLNSGNNYYYYLRVAVPDNVSGEYFNVYITNTGTGGGYPFPYRVIVTNTFRVIHQNILVREASDGIHTITRFDGSEALGNLDVKIYIRLESAPLNEESVKIYYDVDGIPDGSSPDGTVYRNRSVKLKRSGDEWMGIISFTDPEIEAGKVVNFIVSVDNHLYYYDNNNSPWRYIVKEYAIQPEEGKNTISINNKFNPYNGETYHIIYNLKRNSFVNLSIYNIRGELVKQLVNEREDLGRYSVEWDGRNEENHLVSEGLYLVVVTTEDYNEIRKVIIIKR